MRLSAIGARTGRLGRDLDPIALASRIATALRRGPKPLHPRGVVVDGVLARTGDGPPSGVPWIDQPGSDRVLVRCSRGAGLPQPLPDVHGLAIRVPTDDGPADLLLSSARLGRLGRFIPTLRRGMRSGPYASVMPYRGPRGPLLIAARPVGADAFELLWATPTSEWARFGTLTAPEGTSDDAELSFDPIVHPLPGLDTYRWVRALREPAYRAAREQSGRSL